MNPSRFIRHIIWGAGWVVVIMAILGAFSGKLDESRTLSEIAIALGVLSLGSNH